MKRLFILLQILFFSISNAQNIDFDQLREYANQSFKAWNIPGAAIGIVNKDKLIFAEGFGFADLKNKRPIDSKTVFAIASNTKAFTAAAIGILVQNKKIKWNTRIIDVLPDFRMYDPVATAKITVRDMLCHRSGLGLWAGDLNWFNTKQTRVEIIKKIRYIKPVFDLRTSFAYTNLAFVVAGETIPAVTDLSWDDFLKNNIFSPLQMNRTSTTVKNLSKLGNVATPYIYKNGELFPTTFENVDGSGPAAGINSCVDDLSRWIMMQLNYGKWKNRRILDSSVVFETRKPQTLLTFGQQSLRFNPYSHFISYGLGWFLRDYRGKLMVYHSGALDGQFSFVGFLPEENIGIIILTNRDDHDWMYAMAFDIIDRYLGASFEDWSAKYLERDRNYRKKTENKKIEREKKRDKNSAPSKNISEYAGKYVSKVYGNARIISDNGKLIIKMQHHPHIKGILEHWQYDTFLVKWNDPVWDKGFIHFDLDDDGNIKQFRVKVRPDWIDTWEYHFEKTM